jgi:transposase
MQPEASRRGKKEMVRYVGIDVGKAKCRVAVVNQKGDVEDEFFFENSNKGISELEAMLKVEDRVVMESTGNLWLNIYDALDSRSIKVVLANPMQTRASSRKKKTDKVDARKLALLLKAGLISESYVPPGYLREMRALVRHRLSLVRLRTMQKNKVHAILDKYGYRCERSDLYGKAGRAWLGRLKFNGLDRLLVENHVSLIEFVGVQVEGVDAAILQKASEEDDVRLLLSLTGVDVFTAVLIKSEIGTIERFDNYKKLVSWAGLAPSVHQSGEVEFHGGITREGSGVLRWAIVEAAWIAVNHDVKLREFYERVCSMRGKQKAAVAVACKMLKIIWFMLTRREVYGGAKERRYGEKLKKIGVKG